jgi:hypothetical protein
LKLCCEGFALEVVNAAEDLQALGEELVDSARDYTGENLEEFYSCMYFALPYLLAAGRLWKIVAHWGSGSNETTDRIFKKAARRENVTEEKVVRILVSLLSFARDIDGRVSAERVASVALALKQGGESAGLKKAFGIR